jgi:hypothetical protein
MAEPEIAGRTIEAASLVASGQTFVQQSTWHYASMVWAPNETPVAETLASTSPELSLSQVIADGLTFECPLGQDRVPPTRVFTDSFG